MQIFSVLKIMGYEKYSENKNICSNWTEKIIKKVQFNGSYTLVFRIYFISLIKPCCDCLETKTAQETWF